MKTVLTRAALVVLGMLSLPLTALLVDGSAADEWIIPLQLGAATVVGGVLGLVLRGVAAGHAWRRFAVGALLCLAGTVVGALVLFALLVGINPA